LGPPNKEISAFKQEFLLFTQLSEQHRAEYLVLLTQHSDGVKIVMNMSLSQADW
jgi:hypothetical protein